MFHFYHWFVLFYLLMFLNINLRTYCYFDIITNNIIVKLSHPKLNCFLNLDILDNNTDNETNKTDNVLRKAMKKLREIQLLENKTNLHPNEIKKYHPDININKSDEFQKHLGSLKEKYEKI